MNFEFTATTLERKSHEVTVVLIFDEPQEPARKEIPFKYDTAIKPEHNIGLLLFCIGAVAFEKMMDAAEDYTLMWEDVDLRLLE